MDKHIAIVLIIVGFFIALAVASFAPSASGISISDTPKNCTNYDTATQKIRICVEDK